MISNLKKHLEEAIIAFLVIILLSTSLVSWKKIINERYKGNEQALVETEAKEATNQIKRGVVVFTGLMIVVAEYFQFQDEQ